jgi:hypothetical protein
MAPEVKTAKNSKLPKMSENCFEPVGKGGWPPISIWIKTATQIDAATQMEHDCWNTNAGTRLLENEC